MKHNIFVLLKELFTFKKNFCW